MMCRGIRSDHRYPGIGSLRRSGGLRLITMRERARQLNGKFDFENAPGRGDGDPGRDSVPMIVYRRPQDSRTRPRNPSSAIDTIVG